MEKQRLINEIRQAIQEELSIAGHVKEKSLSLLTRIKDEIKNNETEDESDIPGTKSKTGVVRDEFLRSNLSVFYTYYNFLSPEKIKEAEGKFAYSDSNSLQISKKTWFINVKCYGVSGSLDSTDLADSLQHEVEHVYQGIQGKPSLTSPNQTYLNVQCNLANKDEGIRNAAETMYFSYDFEQDGFINGLYAYLREKENPIPRWDDILESELISWLKRVEGNISYLEKEKDNDDLNEKCLNLFGKNVKQIILGGKRGQKRLLDKIGKVLVKVRKDATNEGVVFLISKNGKEPPYVL